MEAIMKQCFSAILLAVLVAAISACGDKKDSSDKAPDVQKLMQEGVQKEKAMMEGMQKGVENLEKKMTEQKDESKK
jgi:predicted small lipoprotein YifL